MSSDYSHDQPSHQQPHLHSSQPQILRPLPRRPFELNLTPATSSSSASSQPSPNPNGVVAPSSRNDASFPSLSAQLDARLNNRSATPAGLDAAADDSDVKRSRSILNLTASTLFGIYQPTAGETGSEPPTPWGTGAETPAYVGGGASSSELREWEYLRLAGLGSRDAANPAPPPFQSRSVSGPAKRVASTSSLDAGAAVSAGSPRGSFVDGAAAEKGGSSVLGLVARGVALFGFGVVYGVMISHLHDNRHIAPVRVEGIDRGHWGYLAFWGLAGVALGSALPWVDLFWEGRKAAAVADVKGRDGKRKIKGQVPTVVGTRSRDGASQEWNDVVRSVGAFVGIAFAIRKLQWQSTTQISVTLAMVNPALWYLLDRSKPGFTLSMLVGITGTAIMLLMGQHSDSVAFIPSPPIVGGSGPNSSVRLGARITGVSGAGGIGGSQGEYESTVGVATWFASVLFCSCVCFGNIGRKLALQG
ncbi:insig domain-containing protein [Diplodia corticola]|uniref:Insig domain-containing protein n=1 Tax=Diplodia corticola TaxID=236234 RepID=A0A1J9S3P4_9PEZI|nr:insig domain-containing protein [Diplodia corticola]OJD35175.1 insig domain-containing protein [Diplodia corticola]